MPDLVSDLWNSDWFRYAGATTIGFFIAFFADEGVQYLQRRRIRQAVREALIDETTDNLQVLDSWNDAFRRLMSGTRNVWPTGRLNISILERCLDASVITALARDEQTFAADSYYQAVALNRDVDRVRESVRQGDLRGVVSLNQELPRYAQNLLNLMLTVLEKQQVYTSERSTWIATRLIPLFEQNELASYRIWRTSSIRKDQMVGRYYIAWENDAKESIPASTTVIELKPESGGWGTFKNESLGLRSRALHHLRKRRALRRLRTGDKKLQDIKCAGPGNTGVP